MMPLPDRDRIMRDVAKGSDFIRRELRIAPEHKQAEQLSASARAISDSSGEAAGRRVLVLSPRDWAYHTMIEGTLATALSVRGADVAVVSCGGGLDVCDRTNVHEAPPMPCRSCTKYVEEAVESFGFNHYRMSEYWEASGDDGTWPELFELSASELADVEFEGLRLGRLVQVPSKWFLLASRSDWDPLSPRMVRKFLVSARRTAVALRQIIEEFQPDTVLMLSGLFLFESVALELCRQLGIEAVTYERTYRQDNLIVRRNAAASHYEISDLWERFADIPLSATEDAELDSYLSTRRTASHPFYDFWKGTDTSGEQRSERPDNTGRTVALFTNVTWDSAVVGRERAFSSIHDWIEATIDAFAHRPNDRLIIRIHPAESKMTGKQTREPLMEFLAVRYPTLPENVRVIGPDEPVHSYPIMEACDVGLAFTSIVGLELALLGKPVIVAGRPHYHQLGFTNDAASPDEYRRLLADALERPEDHTADVELARRYAYTFFFRAVAGFPLANEPVPGLARLTTTDARDLTPGVSPDIDRIIATILSGDPEVANAVRPDREPESVAVSLPRSQRAS